MNQVTLLKWLTLVASIELECQKSKPRDELITRMALAGVTRKELGLDIEELRYVLGQGSHSFVIEREVFHIWVPTAPGSSTHAELVRRAIEAYHNQKKPD